MSFSDVHQHLFGGGEQRTGGYRSKVSSPSFDPLFAQSSPAFRSTISSLMTLPAIQTVPTLEPWRKYQTAADPVTRARQQHELPVDPGSPTSVCSESGSEMDLAGVAALSRSIVREAALSAVASAISNSEPESPHHRTMLRHEGALPRADSSTSLNAISPTHGRIDRKEELRARVQAKDEALRVMAQEVCAQALIQSLRTSL